METKDLVINDYKRWLLYSFDKQESSAYYKLFKALKAAESEGVIKLAISVDSGTRLYSISVENIREELQINEVERTAFLKYLTENYFRTEQVEQAMHQKQANIDKEKNHNYIESKDYSYKDRDEAYIVKPHPKETNYFAIRLAISVIIYAVVAGVLIFTYMSGLPVVQYLLTAVPTMFALWLLSRIMQGIFIGMIKGNSIQVTKDQFPEVYNIIEEQANKLRIKRLPEIYIASGHFNAFVTKLSRAHILLIFSEVIETTLGGNYDVLKYVTAHELCHIKQKHLGKEKYLFPSKIVPFLGLAYSRGCEYTCDRAGYSFSPKGSIEGILIMTTGKEIHSKFNIEKHIQNATANESFWTWLSEKFLTHPHLYKRLREIKVFSRYN